MRLLVISPWYPNRIHPTDGNFVAKLADLVSDEHDVTVLTVVPDPNYKEASPKVTDRREGRLRVVRLYYAGAGARVRRIWARSSAWKAGFKVVGTTYDLVHAHVLIDGGIAAWQFGKRNAVPFVVSEHATRWYEPWPPSRLVELWLARRASRSARFLLPVTESLQRALSNHGVEGNVRVLSNTVDHRIFYPPKRAASVAHFGLLHVSDFSARKRTDLIIAAFFALEQEGYDVRLVVAGDGDQRHLAQLVRALDPRQRPLDTNHPITLLGTQTSRQVSELMRAADAFVLASTRETQSVVILEALMCGLQVVTTRSGGPETILTEPIFGTLTPVDDLGALTAALRTMIRRGIPTEASRTEIAKQANLRYGSKIIKRELLTIYEQATHA